MIGMGVRTTRRGVRPRGHTPDEDLSGHHDSDEDDSNNSNYNRRHPGLDGRRHTASSSGVRSDSGSVLIGEFCCPLGADDVSQVASEPVTPVSGVPDKVMCYSSRGASVRGRTCAHPVAWDFNSISRFVAPAGT